MIVRTRCGLPLMGWAAVHGDGTFSPLQQELPSAVWMQFLHCRETVADPFEEVGQVADVVAWEPCQPGDWWLLRRRGFCVLGEWQIFDGWELQRPVTMFPTPAVWLKNHGRGFCILDWTAPTALDLLDEIEIEFADPWLANRLASARAKRCADEFNARLPQPEALDAAV